MKISVSSYSFSQYIWRGKITQLDTVRLAAELGFEGIEFTDLTGNTLDEQKEYAAKIRAEAEKYGIEIVAYCIGANLYPESANDSERELERLRGQVDVAEILGAKVMRHDVCYSEKVGDKVVSFGKMLPTIAQNARRLTEYAQSKGIRTATENHGFIAQDSDRVEALYNAVDHENYGLLVDIGNFACADEESVKAVSRLAPYAIHVHAKDFHIRRFGEEPFKKDCYFESRGGNYLTGTAVGEGDVNAAHCMRIIQKSGYDGFVSVEYEGYEDCIDGIKKGLENLKRYIGK